MVELLVSGVGANVRRSRVIPERKSTRNSAAVAPVVVQFINASNTLTRYRPGAKLWFTVERYVVGVAPERVRNPNCSCTITRYSSKDIKLYLGRLYV